MNRPYYALAALIAVLFGSSAAVGPAHCQSPTRVAAAASRSLCGMTARDCLVAANLFVHYEAGLDAGARGQGCDNDPACSYEDSCGFDAWRGESYGCESLLSDGGQEVEYWSLYANDFEEAAFENAGTFAEQQEIWPTDERSIDRSVKVQRCYDAKSAGSTCPYYGSFDPSAAQHLSEGAAFDYWTAYKADFDYWTAYKSDFDYWTAYKSDFNYWTAYKSEFDYWTAYKSDFNYWTAYQGDFSYWTAYAKLPAAPTIADLSDEFHCGQWPDEYWACDSDFACQQAQDQWLAEQEARDSVAAAEFGDESAFFEELDESAFFEQEFVDDSWKTRAIETPHWIEDYLSGGGRNWRDWTPEAGARDIEAEYAQAEIQAARDAGQAMNDVASPYGPSLASPVRDRASYGSHYESLYDLDAVLNYERPEEDQSERRTSILRPLSRFIEGVLDTVDELLPKVEQETEQWLDSADQVLEHWESVSSWLPAVQPYEGRMAKRYSTMLPEEAAESREVIESLAGGVRWAGELLLAVADGIEAEAERVLSARSTCPLNR